MAYHHEVVVNCACRCRDHMFVAALDDWEDHDVDLIFMATINHYLPWYRRIGVALRYLFGMDNTFTSHADVVCSPEDAVKVRDLCQSYLDRKAAEE